MLKIVNFPRPEENRLFFLRAIRKPIAQLLIIIDRLKQGYIQTQLMRIHVFKLEISRVHLILDRPDISSLEMRQSDQRSLISMPSGLLHQMKLVWFLFFFMGKFVSCWWWFHLWFVYLWLEPRIIQLKYWGLRWNLSNSEIFLRILTEFYSFSWKSLKIVFN